MYGPPVYVRHEIVHNKYVVESLRRKGAVFVRELDEIPDGDAPVIFSAHGVPKSVPGARRRAASVAIDATCPLVTKVHREAEVHQRARPHIILVGHHGHPEVVGTMGHCRRAPSLCRDHRGYRPARSARGDGFGLRDPDHAVGGRYAGAGGGLEGALPRDRRSAQGRHLLRHHEPPGRGEARRADRRCHDRGGLAQFLQFPAPARGRRARGLPARAAHPAGRGYRLDPFGSIRRLGITAGASAPEVLVEEIIDAFAERYSVAVESVSTADESVFFPLPRELRNQAAE